ncbi:MAG: hypothetical protein HN348_36865, partial [Proteobacteria bacterium]|nr:hypothetical protein [Pseudomonadota bacterium]
LLGEGKKHSAGDYLSSAGDVNGDGFDDLLIGAPGAFDTGAAYLVLGSASGVSSRSLGQSDAIFLGEADDDEAGISVSGAGDVDGDGFDDIVVGALQHKETGKQAGAAYVVLGSDQLGEVELSNADAKLLGESPQDWAGETVSGTGDVNGDGYADFLVGAPGESTAGEEAGMVYLLMGSASDVPQMSLVNANAKLSGEDGWDSAGMAIAGAGDVNGDGLDDLLIGAPFVISVTVESGAAYVVLGSVAGVPSMSLSEADAKLSGDGWWQGAGCAVSGMIDVNNDGFSDVLVGATGDVSAGDEAGAAYLVLGSGF